MKCKDVNKYNSLTNFTFYVLFVIYEREEVKIRHEPSWYNKEKLPSLTYIQLVFFDKFHIHQLSGPPVTSKLGEQNMWFTRYEEGNIHVKNGKYDTDN